MIMSQSSDPPPPPPSPPPPPTQQSQQPQPAQYPHYMPGNPYPFAYPYSAAAGYPPPSLRHSGVGIASVIIAVLSVVGLMATLIGAVILVANDPSVFENEQAPATIAVGLSVIACMLLSLVGAALGIGGLAQRGRKRAVPAIGLSVNALIVLLMLGLIALGMAAG
jgi:hypothetical protein